MAGMKTFNVPNTLIALVVGLLSAASSQAQIFPFNITSPIAARGSVNSGGSAFNKETGVVYNNFSINLTADKQGDPVVVKDTETVFQEVSRFVKAKVGNKEILTAMANDGLLGSTVAGWRLAVIVGDSSPGGTLVAVKKDQEDVEVPATLLALAIGDAVAAYNLRETTNKQGVTTTAYNENGFAVIAGTLAETLPLAGTGNYTLALKSVKVEGEPVPYTAQTFKASISGATGGATAD